MKCYRTYERTKSANGDVWTSDYIMYYWAENRNQARMMLYRECAYPDADYTECYAERVPELDGEPLTAQELYDEGYYTDKY